VTISTQEQLVVSAHDRVCKMIVEVQHLGIRLHEIADELAQVRIEFRKDREYEGKPCTRGGLSPTMAMERTRPSTFFPHSGLRRFR
jgi:hypothetical protein